MGNHKTQAGEARGGQVLTEDLSGQQHNSRPKHGWASAKDKGERGPKFLRSGSDVVDMFSKQLDEATDSARTCPQWKFLQGLLLDVDANLHALPN